MWWVLSLSILLSICRVYIYVRLIMSSYLLFCLVYNWNSGMFGYDSYGTRVTVFSGHLGCILPKLPLFCGNPSVAQQGAYSKTPHIDPKNTDNIGAVSTIMSAFANATASKRITVNGRACLLYTSPSPRD